MELKSNHIEIVIASSQEDSVKNLILRNLSLGREYNKQVDKSAFYISNRYKDDVKTEIQKFEDVGTVNFAFLGNLKSKVFKYANTGSNSLSGYLEKIFLRVKDKNSLIIIDDEIDESSEEIILKEESPFNFSIVVRDLTELKSLIGNHTAIAIGYRPEKEDFEIVRNEFREKFGPLEGEACYIASKFLHYFVEGVPEEQSISPVTFIPVFKGRIGINKKAFETHFNDVFPEGLEGYSLESLLEMFF